MRVLALDTTTRAGSAALVADDRVVDERSGDGARTHALRLPGEIIALAGANQWPLSEIDLYAVASGPGSFTGLRIGIATIQGLAFVHGRRIVGVPALDALAHAGSRDLPEGTLIAAWMDAHRRDVFAALYQVTGATPFSRARLTEVEGPTVGSPASTLARWRALATGLPAVFVGDGAMLYAADIARESPAARALPPPLLAGVIGRLAVARASESLDPAAMRPLYVRRPDAEIARDKKLRKGPWAIEPLAHDDIDDVLAIEEAAFTNPWTRAMYLAELENSGVSFCFLARDTDRRAVGFCSFWRVLDELHINNLAVRPEFRGTGIASALLDFVLKNGAAMGARRATLEVRRSNDAARLLYERFGFSVAGVRRDYYSKPVEDALVLWREELTQPDH